ncbi:unnamed protein product [Gordionus sp. m RMFG-2023]|uniref:IST1 homolog n=1 Tax=Gordionus sp. m RMFG-2023 TaxID=3053472 RepID=UPI0030E4B6B4
MPFNNPNYNKLKTNLRLAINRLKLLEKKKTETALKARREIADYMNINKVDRAKIRVEHIIREDYLVEAMEIIEMLCDLILARFGLIQQMSTMDEGLKEAIASLIWVAPRLQADVPEIKIISDILAQKYGLDFAKAARENSILCVNEKLFQKMSIQAPPKILVEKYLMEIGKSHNVAYTPDPLVMKDEEIYDTEKQLLDFLNNQQDGDIVGDKVGSTKKNKVIGFNYPTLMPTTSLNPNVDPSAPRNEYNIEMPPSYSEFDDEKIDLKNPNSYDYLNLPNVPSSTVSTPAHKKKPDSNIENDTKTDSKTSIDNRIDTPEIDFDDLNRRFEELKKKR